MAKIKAQKGKLAIFLALMLVLATIMVPNVSIAETDQNDISSSANIKLKNVKLNDTDLGSPSSDLELKIGDKLVVSYEWSIKSELLSNEKYFQIKLPNSENFEVAAIAENKEVKITIGEGNSAESFVIGTLSITDGFLRVTLNQSDEHYNNLKAKIGDNIAGGMGYNASAKKAGEDITIPNIENVKLSIKEKTEGNTGNTGSDSNSGALPKDTYEANKPNEVQKKALHKKGEKSPKNGSNPTDIEWVLNVNTDMIKGIYAKGFDVKNIKKKTNVVLVDRLPEGLEIDKESFKITGNVYAPALNENGTVAEETGKWILTSELYGMKNGKSINKIDIKTQDSKENETWQEFTTRIEGESAPVIGFYKKEGIVANFGDVPLDKNYHDVEGIYKDKSVLLRGIDAKKNELTDDQYAKVKTLYVDKKLPILDFTISFKSKIVSPVDKEIVNNATLKWDKGKETGESNKITLNLSAWASGNASAAKRDIVVKKVWKENNGTEIADKSALPEVTVKLTKKDSDGSFKDVNPEQSITLNNANGWTNTFKNLPKYAEGKPIEYGVQEIAVNGYTSKPSGDQKDGFIITNTKKDEGNNKPNPDPKPNPENPPKTPPTPSDNPPTPNPGRRPPTYPSGNTPDPNDPNSPPEITIIDENGVPLGNYEKHQKPDGTYEYVLIDEEVPLAGVLPKTGGNGTLPYHAAGLALVLAGAGLYVSGRKKASK